jgi:hypothetical protein
MSEQSKQRINIIVFICLCVLWLSLLTGIFGYSYYHNYNKTEKKFEENVKKTQINEVDTQIQEKEQKKEDIKTEQSENQSK